MVTLNSGKAPKGKAEKKPKGGGKAADTSSAPSGHLPLKGKA